MQPVNRCTVPLFLAFEPYSGSKKNRGEGPFAGAAVTSKNTSWF